MVGADVGGRLLAPDVLLAGCQRQYEAAPSLGVVGGAHQAPRELTDQLLAARDEADVRTAIAGRQSELLALADGDVGAVLARRREQSKADRVNARDRERAGVVGRLGQPSRVDKQAEEVRLLEDHGRRLV